MGFNIKNNK